MPDLPEVQDRIETWEVGVCYARVNGKPLYSSGDKCRDFRHAATLLEVKRKNNPEVPEDEFCILHHVIEIIT